VLMNEPVGPVAFHSAIPRDDSLLIVGGEGVDGSAVQPYSLHIEPVDDSEARVELAGNKQAFIGHCVPCGLQHDQRVMTSRCAVVNLGRRAVLVGGLSDPFVPHRPALPYYAQYLTFPTKTPVSNLQVIEFAPNDIRVPQWQLLDDISDAVCSTFLNDFIVGCQVESCGLFQAVCRLPSVLAAPHCASIADIADYRTSAMGFDRVTLEDVVAGKTSMEAYGIVTSVPKDDTMTTLMLESSARSESELKCDVAAIAAVMRYIMSGATKFPLKLAPAVLNFAARITGIDSELYTSTASSLVAADLRDEADGNDDGPSGSEDMKISVRTYKSSHFPTAYSRENIAYLKSGRAVNAWLTFTTHTGVRGALPCHREFLIARSPYLCGRFTSTFQESTSLSVDLTRLSGRCFSENAVRALLEYSEFNGFACVKTLRGCGDEY
jgi:hypothetical protein